MGIPETLTSIFCVSAWVIITSASPETSNAENLSSSRNSVCDENTEHAACKSTKDKMIDLETYFMGGLKISELIVYFAHLELETLERFVIDWGDKCHIVVIEDN
jgi:hypothetical protein